MSTSERQPGLSLAEVGVVKSRVGAFFLGSHTVFRGHDLHRELKDMDWLELYMFGVTGRRFTPAQVRLMHAMWVYTSYPDARIWNNRVAALAGSARSTGALGMAAAMAVTEAGIYGGGIVMQGTDFFLRAQQARAAGAGVAELVQAERAAGRRLAGYGRPMVSGDERIPPLLALARELGLDGGPHLRLAFEIEAYLQQGPGLRLNYGGLVCAVGADLGLSARENYLFWFSGFQAGMTPCYLDALDHPEGSRFALPCSHVAYEGPAPRPWRRPAAGQEA